ncbi:MAG: HAMP domain-containing protein [Micavibrio aeruginosavorus]|uniref:histidine kinase n=1 Tax=Micavibrio aeruginosavorus TaxID=349221 RepID=A0A7T5R1I9_9BACT|nr:MAG: HAMP domain-containing protein [Micavibrio aeruginosavorus]
MSLKNRFKKFLPRTIFGRSLLILIMPVLLLQAITAYIFFDRHWEKMTSRLAFAVAGEISIMAEVLEGTDGEKQIGGLSRYAAQHLDLLISYAPGERIDTQNLAGSDIDWRRLMMVDALSAELETKVRRPFTLMIDSEEKWVDVRVQLEEGVLTVSLPQRRLFSSSSYIVILWMIGSSVILLAIAILFMRNQIRPIRRLAVVAERFGRGLDIPSSFKPEGAREVRQAAQAFLDMHERVKRQITQRAAMLAGVSHDLRTPLTRMRLQLAMLPEGPDVEALKHDVADMERMINAYLDFAKGEGGEQPVRTDLRQILDRVVAGMKRQGVDVHLEMDQDLSLLLRPLAFERCLTNIVTNARKYAPHIWVSAHHIDDGQLVEVRVDDDGPGIPEDQREEVFKPFVRVDQSRNASTGGVGLGLPIAREVVHAHGGKIWLEHSPHGGVRAVIHLPG